MTMTERDPPSPKFPRDPPSKKSRYSIPGWSTSRIGSSGTGSSCSSSVSASADRTCARSSPPSGWYTELRNRVSARRRCDIALAMCASSGRVGSCIRFRCSIHIECSDGKTTNHHSSFAAWNTADFALYRSTINARGRGIAVQAAVGCPGRSIANTQTCMSVSSKAPRQRYNDRRWAQWRFALVQLQKT